MSAVEVTRNLFSLMKKLFPERLERDGDCRVRVLRGLKTIKNICKERNVRNVAIVSHRRVIRELSKSYTNKIGLGL
jgi:broad specificity phosphatase PhoE